MKTVTYNPETHVLVPVEPTQAMCSAALAFENNKPLNEWGMIVFNTYEETYSAMLAAAPQPEPVAVGSVGWKHDCAALCANDIELWIDRCPHCVKPRHNHPPTDDELLNKAEQVDSEPFGYYENGRFSVITDGGPDKYRERKGYQGAIYTTPQPDRTAELSALKTENATAWAQANRLALELECLLLDTKDNAIVSKWWDSGMEALSEYQQLKPGAKEEAEAWAKMRKEMK